MEMPKGWTMELVSGLVWGVGSELVWGRELEKDLERPSGSQSVLQSALECTDYQYTQCTVSRC